MDVINSLLRAARAGNLKRVIDFIEDDLVDINSSNQNGLTALHSASKEGHTRVVEELIARGANVHAKTHKGNTALHIASLAGHEPVVRLLIENGADVDAQSVSGFTALYMAAQENHESIVKLLLANRANQNIATTDGFTPLAVAMQQGHEQIASFLLNNEAKGRIRFPGTTESGRSLLHIAAKKDDCAAAALLMQNNISPDITSKSGFTALHVACHYGNENIARLLIDRQADVNFQAKHNITPLHVASKWGKETLVDLLLANGARIDATTKDGLTPLHCAARSGHDTVVEDLIKRGAPISAKTRSGLAPLHMATQGDHHGSAQILLNNGAPVDDVTIDYLTALHVASHCGHVKVAKLLLNNRADPNFRALNGFTSLHIACKKNRLKVVELLLKYGASMNSVTESGLTPLHVASFMGCVNIVVYLLDNNANIEPVTVRGETPLHLATRANQIDVINVLLQYGANVSARAKESQTALHIASRLGNADIAKLLLQQGIDVDAPTKDSYTGLHIAAKEGHDEVVAALLDHGANISCATRNHGFTPLHLASKYGIDGVVDLLLSYGAPVDAQGKNGVTPLHVATHYNHPNVVQLLLMPRGHQEPGASPHAMAKNGYTALHIAAKGNRLEIANALLQAKANPSAESKAGFCPLHLAAQEGRTDMAALLLNQGAQVNCRAKNGITPLHLCAQEDHVNVAQLLVKRGAQLDAQTKGGFTPLHVASHFARIKMIMFLLANGANVNIPAASGYTPLHQASQQGNPEIVDLLLQYNAKPDALTEGGQTALSIAQNLGYVSIIDTLKVVTETVVKTTTMTITEEKFKIVAPETMQETFVSDSEDEADDQAHAESVKFLTTADVMKNFNTMTDDYHTSQSNLMGAPGAEQQQQLQQQQQLHGQQQAAARQQHDEMSQDLNYLAREAPLDGGESTFGAATSYSQLGPAREDSVLHMGSDMLEDTSERQLDAAGSQQQLAQQLDQLSPDNVDIQRPLQQAGFLVSFMVDARGGAMRGRRHSGVRVIIPPNSAQMPTRITCRYLRRERLVHPPPLMEGEACASKIMEVGPAGAKFLAPVLIEVPHFASLRGDEREIIILRSDTGDVWREHLVEADERLIDQIIASAQTSQQQQQSKQHDDYFSDQENLAISASGIDEPSGAAGSRRLTRIVTTEFPQYFAIISRIRQEDHAVGPSGSTVTSQVVPKVQAIFPQGALKKRIKIGLQNEKPSDQVNEGETSQHADGASGKQRPTSPDEGRAASPASGGSIAGHQQQRPGSAAAKRRSRFLACFGSGHGSVDALETTSDESSLSAGGAGADSPRQPCKERPVEKRYILGDVSDAESVNSVSVSPRSHTRKKRHANHLETVPDNYYLEEEPPLILNMEPKTYGKRLASSSAQTDSKLQVNGFMSITTKGPIGKKKKRGLLTKRQKHKTELTIKCNPVEPRPKRPVSPRSVMDSSAPDSSLDTVDDTERLSSAGADEEAAASGSGADEISLIQDVITSKDQKWRTCTIQTDSDSVTVNYVTTSDVACNTDPSLAGTGLDDGYVSGSGELGKQQPGGKGGLFKPLNNVASDTKKPATPQPQSEPSSKTSRAKKQAKKAQKKSKQKKQQQPDAESASSSNHEASTTVTLSTAPVAELPSSVTPEPPQQQQQPTSLTTDESIGAETDGLSTGRSVSPSSKELKQRAKQERQEQLRKAKEEKRLQKEAEEAAAKVEKAKKKLEKEKEKAKKADKSSKSSGKKSPEPQVVPAGASSGGGGKGTSVTFANDLIEAKVDPAPANLESAIEEQVTAAAASGIEHNRLERSAPAPPDTNLAASSDGAIVGKLGQEDGRDMVRVSISNEPPAPIPVAESLQETADEVASQILATAEKQVAAAAPDDDTGLSVKEPESSVSESMAAAAEQPASLKPILKQQSTSVDESGAELIMSGPPSAATAATENRTTETTELDSEKAPSKKELAKLAKARKAEAKQREDEAKKLAKEEKKKAKEAKKAAEAEAKRLAAEAKKQKETSVKSQDVDVDVDSKPQVPAESEADVVTEPKSSLAEVTENETDEPAASSSSFLDKLLGGKKKKKPKSKKAKKSKSAEAKQSDSEKVDESSEIKLPLTTAAAPVVEKPEILSEMYPSDPDDADGEMILEVNVPKQLLERDTNDLSQASDTIASPTTHASTTIDETLATATYGDLPSASQKRATISHDESMAGDDQEATLVNSEDVDDEEATENAVSQAHDLTEADPLVVKDLPEEQVPSPIAEPAQHAEALAAPEVAAEVAKSKSELKKEEKKRRELEVKLEKERKKLEKEEEKAKKLRAKEEEARLKLEQKAAAEEAKKRAKEEKEKAKNEKKEQKKRNKKQKDVAKDPAQASTSAPSDEAVTPSIVVSSGEAQVASPEADAEQLDSMTPVNTETEVERTVEEVMGEDGVLTRTTKTIETKYVTLRQEEVKQSERRDMPADEFEQLKRDEEVATAAHDTIERLADERQPPVAEIATSAKSGELAAQLEEIQSAPSCFDPDFKPNPAKELSPKKDQQRRVKLNQKLVKRALKLARAEKKHARTCAKTAEAEIAVCDEAARQAQKQLKHAAKEARRAGKEAAKWHKKMDKVDKKLAKRQKKIEKRQRKLDKRAAKLAKEEAKRREKALAKEAKEAKALERKASKKSNKSLKLEDIGDPVLKSSSRLSIGGVAATAAAAIDTTLPTTSGAADADVIVAEVRPSAAADGVEQLRSSSPVSDGMHVEMSLDDSHPPVEPQSIPEELGELLAEQVSLNISRQVREGQEPEVSVKQEPTESDEEIDVLNELPSFGERSKQLHQQAEQAE